MTKQSILEKLRRGLIVSCQALPGEPLHGRNMMAAMALSAKEGGASGIRANGVEDIRAIRKEVDLPMIGIVKADYPDSPVFITPTQREVDALLAEGVEIIALDATARPRPGGLSLEEFFLCGRSIETSCSWQTARLLRNVLPPSVLVSTW